MALCREEEPEVEIRIHEVPLSQQLKGLHDDLYDLGFAQLDEVGDGLVAEPIWYDPLMVALPARHPLLAHKRLPLDEVLRYPLALGDEHLCEGHARQIDRILRQSTLEPLVVERVASFNLMMTLVSAGFALGLAGASQIASSHDASVVARMLAGRSQMLTTYVLRLDNEPSDTLARFIERVFSIEPPSGKISAGRTQPIHSEDIDS
ncbi:LysR family substrate-binding domain-containing protein [Ralstonia solanacearum]|nr:LysR family substrate-binding domain-containing protein [Ralstonia solanacearum]